MQNTARVMAANSTPPKIPEETQGDGVCDNPPSKDSRSSHPTPSTPENQETTGYRSGTTESQTAESLAEDEEHLKSKEEKKDNGVCGNALSKIKSSDPKPSTAVLQDTGYESGLTKSQTAELLAEDEDASTATSEHQDRSEQDEGNVDENKEDKEHLKSKDERKDNGVCGNALSKIKSSDPTPSTAVLQDTGYRSGVTEAQTAESLVEDEENQTRPEQEVGYDARRSKLVVGHTHGLPILTDVDELVIGVKMIQLPDSVKLSLCI